MAIPSKQIGQSTESNLLWNISKQIEWFTKVISSSISNLSGTFVPYTGANNNIDLGSYTISTYAFINPNGDSNSFLKADGTLDNTAYTTNLGTVTRVNALNVTTIGTTITSSVTNSSTTPIITLNLPTAGSTTAAGLLSSANWTTFNNKQNALTNPVTGAVTINTIPKRSGSTTADVDSSITDNGSLVTIGNPTKFIGANTIQGTVASDTAPLGSELTTTGTGTNWTGTGFSTGYTHTPGSTANLTSSLVAVSGTYYQIVFIITGRTAGTVGMSFGGIVIAPTAFGGTYGQIATSTASLVITPTTDFDGVVTLSIKTIGVATALSTYLSSVGTIISEVRVTTATFGNSLGIGTGAFRKVTTGGQNTAVGNVSAFSVTTGNSLSAFGNSSLNANTIGSGNSAFGANSLGNNVSGSNTSALGYLAGMYIADRATAATIISNSVLIGYRTSPLADNQTNQIVIGYDATGLGSNTTVIGNSSTVISAIYGNLLLGGTTNIGAKLYVTGSSVQNGNLFFAQPTPTTKTVTGTLSIAELLTSIITITSSVAVSLTLPTGTLTDAGILGGLLPIQNAFEWTVINLGSSVGITTIVAGVGHTIVGLATIPILSQATFRTTKTATNTFVTYRVY